MKSRLIILSLALFLSFNISAQEAPEIQKTLLTKITATWCPNCGTWGWEFFEDIITDNAQKAVFVGAHHSGDLQSAPGTAFKNNFNAPYQPYFYAGNLDLGVTSNNIAAKRTETKTTVDNNYLQAPLANVGIGANLTGNTMSVTTNTKFFQQANGDYYVGLYILENNVVNNQSEIGAGAIHPYVMRKSFTDENFGLSVVSGAVSADTELQQTFTTELNASWNVDNIIVTAILWELVDDTYQFVNVNTTTDFSFEPVSVSTIAPDVLSVEISPTIAESSTTLNIDLSNETLKTNIQLFNVNGQAVRQIFQGNLTEGQQSMEINTSNLSTGVYFVSIRTERGEVLTKKFIVK